MYVVRVIILTVKCPNRQKEIICKLLFDIKSIVPGRLWHNIWKQLE